MIFKMSRNSVRLGYRSPEIRSGTESLLFEFQCVDTTTDKITECFLVVHVPIALSPIELLLLGAVSRPTPVSDDLIPPVPDGSSHDVYPRN